MTLKTGTRVGWRGGHDARRVDEGTKLQGATRALWSGEVDADHTDYLAARIAQERMTGAPMPNMSRHLLMARWPSRPDGYADTIRWGACELQMEPTTTFSEPTGWLDEGCECAGERLCAFWRKWRADERKETQYAGLKDVWLRLTTPRRRTAAGRDGRTRLLPGVGYVRDGLHVPGVWARGPTLPRWAQGRYLMQCVAGIESIWLMATRADGNRCTHINPTNMPLVGQVFCFLGVPPTMNRLPQRMEGVNGPGASTPSALREIKQLESDGFALRVSPSSNVWRAPLAGIPKSKTPPCDLLGLMDDMAGSVSKHLHAERAAVGDFRRRHGVQSKTWREQRNELRDEVLAMCGETGQPAKRRECMIRLMDRIADWWEELHQTEEEEYRVIFNQRGDMNDSYRTMRLTMSGCQLLLSMCSTGSMLVTSDERRGYWQVLQSVTHRLLLGMRLPTGEDLMWCRAPMGNKASSDNFMQQVVWQKMVLGLFDPYRHYGVYLNTPEMVPGGEGPEYNPDLPTGLVYIGSDGLPAAVPHTFADDWAHVFHEALRRGRAMRQANIGRATTTEACMSTGRHLHRTKGQGPAPLAMFTGLEVLTCGGSGGRPYMRIPEIKQFSGQIRLLSVGFKCGLHLVGLIDTHMKDDMSVREALRMTREGSPLWRAVKAHGGTRVTRRELAGATGYFNHLSAVVNVLGACMRSLSQCIYDGVECSDDTPSDSVDWDGDCEVSVRAWLDMVRAVWILRRGYYTKILSKPGRTGMFAIQDASEEDGGGFCGTIDTGEGKRARMKVYTGRHTPRNRGMTSGPKELAFVCRSIREAVKLFREEANVRGECPTDEEERRGVLGLLDPDLLVEIGRLLLFTDSAVSVFAAMKGYSGSVEMQMHVDEIEVVMMESGIEVCFKHLPSKKMIETHVDGASRRDAGPLLRVRDPMDIHPYAMHKWGITKQMREAVAERFAKVTFIENWSQLSFEKLPGTTFCFCMPPESLLPIAMRALEMWTARPSSTRVIMMVARDFGTPPLRAIIRQFDRQADGRRFQRLKASEADCVWDTLMAVKSPLAPSRVHSADIRREHTRLMAEGDEHCEQSNGHSGDLVHCTSGLQLEGSRPSLRAQLDSLKRNKGCADTCNRSTSGDAPSSPQGAAKAYELGLGKAEPARAAGGRPLTGRAGRDRLKPATMESLLRNIKLLSSEQAACRLNSIELSRDMECAGARVEQIDRYETSRAKRRLAGEGNTLLGRKLTGGKHARRERTRTVCTTCGHRDQSTEMFACRFREVGPVSKRHGPLGPCGGVLCHRCLASGVPSKAHPSRAGRAAVPLTVHHARLVAGSHVCTQCRWRICTGTTLDVTDEEDRYVWQLITQYLLDMYRHLTPATTSGYAREVNLLADFAAALPSVSPDDVLGCVSFNEEDLRVSTIHAMLWLHLERDSRLKYGTIRKARSVVTKLAEVYGEASPLNEPGSEFKRFTKAFKMRVGTASRPSPALSVKAWFAMIRHHSHAHAEAVELGNHQGARDILCRLVHAELSFLGFLRASEQVCMQREDMIAMLCMPQRARVLGVQPYICLPLMGPTKTSTNEASGVVVCWTTKSGVRIGEHVGVLLQAYLDEGKPTGALLTHGRRGTPWTKTHALHYVVRPTLEAIRDATGCIDATVKLSWYTLNCFRRGGNTHARDRGVKPWECVDHGRWEGQWDEREGMAMVDLYDATGTDRKLAVTSKMC